MSDDCNYALTLSEKCITFRDATKKIPEGSLLRIQTMDEYGKFTFYDETEVRKFFKTRPLYESSSIDRMLFFSKDIFDLALAITSLKHRILFCQSEEKQKFLLQLQTNDPVRIPEGAFYYNTGTLLRGFVKYKGSMEEVGPGIHFIVTLMVIFFYIRELKSFLKKYLLSRRIYWHN